MEPTITTPTPNAGTPASGAVGTSTGEPLVLTPPPGPSTATPATPAQPAATATPAAPGAAPAAPRRVTMAEDDFKGRLARAKRQALADLLGTDDAEAIKAKLARAEALEKEADERKRAEMSEVERLQHDLARQRQVALRAQAEARALREQQEIREQQRAVETIAARHVAGKFVGMASRELREHLRSLDPKAVDGWTEKDIAKWFQAFAAKQPEIAASARTRTKAPIGASTQAPRPATDLPSSTAGTNGGKTFRPGQSNSMTRAEARESARKLGYTW